MVTKQTTKTKTPPRTISNNKEENKNFESVKNELFILVRGKAGEDSEFTQFMNKGITIIDKAEGLNFRDKSKLQQLLTKYVLGSYSLLPPSNESINILRRELNYREERRNDLRESRKNS